MTQTRAWTTCPKCYTAVNAVKAAQPPSCGEHLTVHLAKKTIQQGYCISQAHETKYSILFN